MLRRLFWDRAMSQRAATWTAVLYTATSGNLLMALAPMFWSGYSEYLHFSDDRIANLFSGEFYGSTAATVAGIFYMHRQGLDLRHVQYASLAIYMVCNALTPFLYAVPEGLMFTRVCCGAAAGTSYLAAATAITGIGSPPRLMALFYGAPFITGALLQPLMQPLFAHWGLSAAFELMAVAPAACAALYRFFPRFADDQPEPAGARALGPRSKALLGIISTALLLQYTANSGIWLFFPRIGEISGHPAQLVATIVGVSTGMALLGTWLSALLSQRLGPVQGILWGTGVIMLSSLSLLFSTHLVVFAGSAALFNVMITFLTPFYFILMVRIYAPARAVIVGNICLALGFAAGPQLIGYTVHGSQFSVSIAGTAVMFALSAALVLLFQFLSQRPAP